MTSFNQASDSTKQLKEQQYTEEHYRAIQKHAPRLRNNTPPVCTNKRSYELIIRRIASDTGKPFYECEICGRVTTDYSNLNKHCRLHTGEKPFKCNACGKAFSDRSDYDVHCRIHNGINPYDCNVCRRAFRTSSNLKSHSCGHKTHHSCYICGKSFPTLLKLDFHENSHEGEYNYYPLDY